MNNFSWTSVATPEIHNTFFFYFGLAAVTSPTLTHIAFGYGFRVRAYARGQDVLLRMLITPLRHEHISKGG